MNEAPRIPVHGRGRLASRLVAAATVLASFSALAWADAVGFAGAGAMAWLLPVVLVVAAGSGREAVRLAAGGGIGLDAWIVPIGAAAIAAAPALVSRRLAAGDDPWSVVGPAAATSMAVVAAAFVAGVARYTGGGGHLVRTAGSIAAAVSIGLPMAFMVALRLLPAGVVAGRFTALVPLVSLIAVVKAGDIAAYAVGSLVGRHRMAPALSPGKTWEGAAASLAASLGVAWMVLERMGCGLEARPCGGWPVFGVLVGVAGMLGDLAESLVKRDLAAKDSGQMLGGMGGFLDLVDSLLLAAPVAWLLWALG
ncbi:MAG: phosphatidate cytidylyltransferase [Planctomycetaceae bacterium]